MDNSNAIKRDLTKCRMCLLATPGVSSRASIDRRGNEIFFHLLRGCKRFSHVSRFYTSYRFSNWKTREPWFLSVFEHGHRLSTTRSAPPRLRLYPATDKGRRCVCSSRFKDSLSLSSLFILFIAPYIWRTTLNTFYNVDKGRRATLNVVLRTAE